VCDFPDSVGVLRVAYIKNKEITVQNIGMFSGKKNVIRSILRMTGIQIHYACPPGTIRSVPASLLCYIIVGKFPQLILYNQIIRISAQ
jgi:hypothetical protein